MHFVFLLFLFASKSAFRGSYIVFILFTAVYFFFFNSYLYFYLISILKLCRIIHLSVYDTQLQSSCRVRFHIFLLPNDIKTIPISVTWCCIFELLLLFTNVISQIIDIICLHKYLLAIKIFCSNLYPIKITFFIYFHILTYIVYFCIVYNIVSLFFVCVVFYFFSSVNASCTKLKKI